MALCAPMAWAQADEPEAIIEDVTTQEVKNFLDPTVMINSFDYTFAANFLPFGAELYTNNFSPFWAVNRWTGFWAEIPVHKFALPERDGGSGVGDILLGWGAIAHENLESRFTTSIITFEALAPSGDPDEGTGVGTWILAPGGALAINPTDEFPIYIIGRYLHSLESLGGRDRARDVADRPDLRVRSLELTIQTVHVLPKGFFISAIPSFVFNFNRDFNFFSLGVGGGRALNRNFAISGGYVHHVAGRETFNQVLTFQLSFLFGRRKDE